MKRNEIALGNQIANGLLMKDRVDARVLGLEYLCMDGSTKGGHDYFGIDGAQCSPENLALFTFSFCKHGLLLQSLLNEFWC